MYLPQTTQTLNANPRRTVVYLGTFLGSMLVWGSVGWGFQGVGDRRASIIAVALQ